MSGEIKKRLDQLIMQLDSEKLAQVAYPVFKKLTPIRSGRARNSTELNRNDIIANYPYAKRLDQGYSKQAPNGMVTPTFNYLQKYMKRIAK
jgi:hypothetical protein